MALLWDEIAKDGSLNLFLRKKTHGHSEGDREGYAWSFSSVLLLQDPHQCFLDDECD